MAFPRGGAGYRSKRGDGARCGWPCRRGCRGARRCAGLQWSDLRDVPRTGANWKGPIQDFHLILEQRASADLLSLCFEGALQRADALTFAFRQRDVVPDRDLDILFLH
ncbi:MAG: DUF4424 family protein [Xanthomonas sp.]